MNRDTTIQQDILKALVYFDIFRYPLTIKEIIFFLQSPATEAAVQQQLALLQQGQQVFCVEGLYMLQNDAGLVERRKKGNQQAIAEMKTAVKTARWLYRFPYVRSIAVSGSLSKNYADAHTDIDFFVITATGRLWVARTLLHLQYKVLWLMRRRWWFCLNYYIDDSVLEIEEKNIFTATEIVTLIPLEGAAVFDAFANANSWVKQYFPQYTKAAGASVGKGGMFKRFAEWLLNNKFGNWLEKRLQGVTNKRWQKKMHRNAVNQKGIKISMLSGLHHAKPDPAIFQQKIIEQYQQGIGRLANVAALPVE